MTEFQIMVDNDSENIHRKSPEAFTDRMADPDAVRRSKSEYQTLEMEGVIPGESQEMSVSQNAVAGLVITCRSRN